MIADIEPVAVRSGFDGRTFWAQARAGAIPGHEDPQPTVVLTAQRFDLDDGHILLPIYFMDISNDLNVRCSATVLCCAFDGSRLEYLEHGTEMTVPEPRGLCEPSLIRCQGQYFLTLRNDVRGYVARSKDGLHFDTPRPWCFDDGEVLGNYNTQQHWVAHNDALFLVYTRRGLNNDHVFRHRAPLMMAQVDPAGIKARRTSGAKRHPEGLNLKNSF